MKKGDFPKASASFIDSQFLRFYELFDFLVVVGLYGFSSLLTVTR